MSLFRQLLIANSRKKKRKFYCELEYLESTGTQYIDTGVAPSNITPIAKMKFIPTQQLDKCGIFGCWGANNKRFQIFFNSIGIGTYVDKSWKANTIYEVELNGKVPSATINGKVETSGYSNTNGFSSDNMYLFTRNNVNVADDGVPLKLYYCKIYDNDILVRDFIPVLDWDMKPCMYDKVSGELFYNKGSGEFLYGRQIHPVEYLESTGTQWIDTGYVINSNNPQIKTKLQIKSYIKSYQGLFANYVSESVKSTRISFVRENNLFSWYLNSGSAGNYQVIPAQFNTDWEIDLNEDALIINGVSVPKASSTQSGSANTATMKIFTQTADATYASPLKMYYFKMYDNSSLVRDFIPAVDQTGKGFMFDRVSHTIYDNAGTGAFGYNPVELEYLESTGTQYIDTGLRLTQNNAIEVCYKINSISVFSGIVGARSSANSNNISVNANTGGVDRPFISVDFNNSNFEIYRARYGTRTSDKILVYLDKHIRNISINNSVVDSNNIECNDAIETQSNCLLFRATGISGYCDLNVYYCKIWDNDTLVRDFIPVFYNGQLGMWDKVNEVFYPNKGTNNFIGGPVKENEYE